MGYRRALSFRAVTAAFRRAVWRAPVKLTRNALGARSSLLGLRALGAVAVAADVTTATDQQPQSLSNA